MGWRFTVPQLVCGGLIAANGLVFLWWTRSLRGAHSFEAAHPFLRRHFLHHAFAGRALPLIGSAFSHVTFPHFLFNMMALWSFGQNLVRCSLYVNVGRHLPGPGSRA
jgi:membrane associated rhomboid family serine protease